MRRVVFGLLGLVVLVGMAGLKRYVIYEVNTHELADDIASSLNDFVGDDPPVDSAAQPTPATPSAETLTALSQQSVPFTIPSVPTASGLFDAVNGELQQNTPAAFGQTAPRGPSITSVPAQTQSGPSGAAQVVVIRPKR